VVELLHPPVAAPLSDVDSARLHLRRPRPEDLDGLAAVFAHREVWEYPFGRAFSRDESEAFLRRQLDHWDAAGFGLWFALLPETGRLIGYVGLSVPMFLPEILPAVEVGWRFDPSCWGRGFATEAALAALREGFETLELDEITSIPQADNVRSGRVCERLGMRFARAVAIPATDTRGGLTGQLYVMARAEWDARAH
jgi:RimJ/RimL family protein N-acetyltransferase